MFGSGRAETVCPWPETFIPGWSQSALAFCSCMGEKQTPPQSMSFSMLLLLAFYKQWGFASYYVHIFVIFWPARGSVFYGMCPACCWLRSQLSHWGPVLQQACRVQPAPPALAPEKACDGTAQSFLQWLTLLLKEDRGVSLWGWQCRVRGLELASNEFTAVQVRASCGISVLGKLCSCLQYACTL